MDTKKVGLIALGALIIIGVVAASTGSIPISQNNDGVVLNQPGGPAINLTGNTDILNTSGTVSSSTIQWNTSAGSARFSASGDASATISVSSLDGSWVNLTSIDASAADLTVRTGDVAPASISGAVTALSYPTASLIDITDMDSDLALAASGDGQITLNNLPASRDIVVATESGTRLDVVSTDASGSATIDIDTTSGFQGIVLFDPESPTVENGTATPQGGSLLSSRDIQLSIQVNDTDFAYPGGDTATLIWYLDGAKVETTQISSNQTASTTVTPTTGGNHTWHIEVSDAFGRTAASESFVFSVPSELEILNESSPTKLVKNVSVDLQFYYSSGGPANIYSRNASDGTINMTDLPVTRPFVVVADAEGYYPRRIFVPSLYNTQQVFLLPKSKTAVEVIFEIQDYTGKYPQDSSVLVVQRALNGSWQTVVGDYFGSNGEFPAQLRYNTRHRLKIRNTETGETRVLGSFTPLSSGSQAVTVTPRSIMNVTGAGVITEITPSTRMLPARDGVSINATVEPTGDSTLKNFSVTVYYDVRNGGNTSIASLSSLADDGGTLSPTLDLANRSAGQVVVVLSYHTDSGAAGDRVVRYAVPDTAESQYSLLAGLNMIISLIAPANQASFASSLALVLSLVLTAAIASQIRLPTEMIGLVYTGLLTAFAILGWVGYNLVFVAAVAWGSLVFLGRRY